MNKFVSLVALCALVALATAGHSRSGKGEDAEMEAMKENFHSKMMQMNDVDPKCCRRPVMAMDSCCKAPEVVSRPLLEACAPKLDHEKVKQWMKQQGGPFAGPSSAQGGGAAPGAGGAPQAPAAFSAGRQRGENRGMGMGMRRSSMGKGPMSQRMGPMGPRGMGPMGPSPCAVDCVFQNQSLYNEDGSINVAKMVTFVTASVGPAWASSVQAGVEECVKGAAGANMSGMPTPPPGIPRCNHTAKMVLVCMRRHFLINCAADAVQKGDNCSAKVDAVKACDPFKQPKFPPPGAFGMGPMGGRASGMMRKMSQMSGKMGEKMGKFGDAIKGGFKRMKGKSDAAVPVASVKTQDSTV